MRIRNISPVGALVVPALDNRTVGAGEEIDVADDFGAELIEQIANWEEVE